MNFKECSHYKEIIKVISEGGDLNDVNFEIDDTHHCKECYKTKGVCQLWIMIKFVEDMKQQTNISEANTTVDNLNEQMKKVIMRIIRNTESEDNI